MKSVARNIVWLLLTLLMSIKTSSSTHFRGGIIMARPLPGGHPNQMEISYFISWRRSYESNGIHHYCDDRSISSGVLNPGQGDLLCQYGCRGTVAQMSYVCTSFSAGENWTFGQRQLNYTFSSAINVTIGFSGTNWIAPFEEGAWNISTSFSLSLRNDTGRINSTPRAITAPVIRLLEGCNHTLTLAVNDPDGDIIRCRWAQGSECAGICGGFPGAVLHSNMCVIEYRANRGVRVNGVALMLEDFLSGSSTAMSSVALQFIVNVTANTDGSCSQMPVFIRPTIFGGSCVAIPPESTFTTQLVSDTNRPDVSILEIQTVSPFGTRVGELTRISNSSIYYVNVSWTPTISQQNQTHMLCFTAVASDTQTSSQTCISLLPGYFPPTPLRATASPNRQLVHPSNNTTWRVRFDINIERSSVEGRIIFREYDSDETVYSIDASRSQEVAFEFSNELSITPNFTFAEKTRYYITFERHVVQGLEQCGAGNEPLVDKNFWVFDTMDLTPPNITFLSSPAVSNGNISIFWESNENVTWSCLLRRGSTEVLLNCSSASWSGYDLGEGQYFLLVVATDYAGNVANLTHPFWIDRTPPIVVIHDRPNMVSNERMPNLTFSCDENMCMFQCCFLTNACASCNFGWYITPMLQANTNYTFQVRATDQVGNQGDAVAYSWETDFEAPQIFGVQNASAFCNSSSPNNTGQPQALDDRPIEVLLTYNDSLVGCSIHRNWRAVDVAGNTAFLLQIIDLEFFPTVSLLQNVSLPCDSAAVFLQLQNNTAFVPNPCAVPVQLTHVDFEPTCPGSFLRNWTVSSCGRFAYASQRVQLYDLCPSDACGRGETIPRGTCSFGECQCNRPWYGENCDVLIYEPAAEPVFNITLLEGQSYATNVSLSRGTPPLSWILLSGPTGLLLDQYSGEVTWRFARAGTHPVLAQIENQVGTGQVEWTLQVLPIYNATLSAVSNTTFPYSQPVELTGHINYTINDITDVGSVLVHIDITSNGTTRTAQAYTASNGTFTLTFIPSSTEYGTYFARARHPSSSSLFKSQIQWKILGMKTVPNQVSLNGATINEFEGTFHNVTFIYNDGPGILTGITATAELQSTRDVSVEISLRWRHPFNLTFAPGDELALDIRVVVSQPIAGTFLVTVDSREGTQVQLIVNLRIEPILPRFFAIPSSLNGRIVRGQSRIFELNITNVGQAQAQNVRSLLPETNFISIIGFGSMEQNSGNGLSLENEESVLLSILVQVPETLELGILTATAIVASDETFLSLPISLTVSSASLMNLTVLIEDEYTYFASGRPLVSDARVTLINYQRDLILSQSGNGSVEFSNIYEDRYEMLVEAPSHRELRQIIVTSADSPTATVFIERQTVTYTFTVTPVTFQDNYVISIEADFETHVPIPVVTVTPTEIDLDDLEAGLITSFQINVTNHGLIRAENVEISFPTHPSLAFSTNRLSLGDLEALSSVLVLINSTRRSIQKRNAPINVTYPINFRYGYVCDRERNRIVPVILWQTRQLICGERNLGRSLRNAGGGGGGRGSPVNLDGDFSGGGRANYRLGFGSGPPPSNLGAINPPSPSFNGFSSVTPVFCNPCLSTILGCLAPSPFDLLKVPLSGCIPLILNRINPVSSVSNALDWIQCVAGNKITGTILCSYRQNLFGNCLNSGSSRRRKRTIRRALREYIEALFPIQQSMALGIEVLGDEIWISVGDPQWLARVLRPALDDSSEGGMLISAAELSAILTAPPPNGTTPDMVARLVERVNNTIFGWNSGLLEPSDSSNMASLRRVQEYARNIDRYNAMAVDRGFSSYIDAYNFVSGELNQADDLEAEAGVCAVVRIRIQQELAITREAFVARLEISNMEDSSLQQISVKIVATDLLTGEQASHLFAIGNATLSGSLRSSADDSWSLPSDATGAVEWFIIPYSAAAPNSDRIFNIGGSFSYLFDEENITVPLYHTPITVTPDPSLLVHYFWERNVLADDPFTEEVEPSIPFTLGVAVKNAGYGTAYNLMISSAQPEIIQNERGLLIDFMIIGANIGSEPATPSLTVTYGDLLPNTTIVARWFMISSLQGEFMRYSATFENMNPLGDPKLSILDDLQIHELIKNVYMYTPSEEDDGILDFLVNDRSDLSAYPDALYSSRTLERYNVSVGLVTSVQAVPGREDAQHIILRTTASDSGWVYYRYEDTQNVLSVIASSLNVTKLVGNENITLPSQNSWITRNRDGIFFLHIVDYLETLDEEVVFRVDLCRVNCLSIDVPFVQPIQLPTPSVFIYPPPEDIYFGTSLTLTCDVNFDPNLASFVNVTIAWLRGSIPLYDETGKISIVSALLNAQVSSNLTIHSLSSIDSSNFTCRASLTPSDNGTSTVTASDPGEGIAEIFVQMLYMPEASISASSSSPVAGDMFTLTCSIEATPENVALDPILTWNGPGVGSDAVQFSSCNLTALLTFNPLQTSHGGVYACEATFNSSQVGVSDMTRRITANVTVQIPTPEVVILEHPIPYNGTVFTLQGVVRLNGSVDTNITAISLWSDSDSEQRAVSPPYLSTLEFRPLTSNNSKNYSLNVTIVPSMDSAAFVVGSSANIVYRLIVQPLPRVVPIITASSFSSNDSCGGVNTFNCSFDELYNLFNPPHLLWMGPDGNAVSIGEDSNPSVNSSTGELVFSGITSNNTGTYVCHVVINIPESEIFNKSFGDVAVTISNNTPAPVTGLECNRSNSASVLSFSWGVPTISEGVSSYQVIVKKLQLLNDTKEEVLVDIANFVTQNRWAFLDQELSGMVPYKIEVLAINSAGCGEQHAIYCFTEEGVPPPPQNVMTSRLNSTAIKVSWDRQSLVELKGVAEYVVEYNQVEVRKRQTRNRVTVPWTQNSVTIASLKPGAQYSVTVSTSTSAGMSEIVSRVITADSPSSPDSNTPYLAVIIAGAVLGSALLIAILACATIAITNCASKSCRHGPKSNSDRAALYEMPVSEKSVSLLETDATHTML